MMRRGIGRNLRTTAVAAVLACAVFAGTALAAGNSVSVGVAGHVGFNKNFTVKLSGHAAKKSTLYLFIDALKCGSSPGVEHFTHHANGVFWSLKKGGSYTKPSGWKVGKRGTFHACGYLVKASEPLNSTAGVLARGSKAFKVQ